MAKTKGRVTLPSEANFLEETKEMMERWGADALRDSGEVERMRGHAYGTYTNLAFKLATGRTARQLRRERGAAQDVHAVDILTAVELEIYQRKEAAIAVLLDAGLTYDSIKAALAGEAVNNAHE